MSKPMISFNSGETNGHKVIEAMVRGYACQDLEAIIPLFDENAIYQDMAGKGEFGNTMRGTSAIRDYFAHLFSRVMPSHTYEDAIIFGEGKRMCANWTLVLGSSLKASQQYRVRGGDFFIVEDGKVVEKSAFLKFSVRTYIAIVRIRIIEAFQSKRSKNKHEVKPTLR